MNLSPSLEVPEADYSTRLRLDRNEVSKPVHNFPIKLLFLTLSTLCLTGNYYSYDLPAALNRQLKSTLHSTPEWWQLQLALLYSAYFLPNILLPFYAARFVDRLGSRFSIIFFSLLVVTGQYLFVVGLQNNFFYLMILGRILLGIGGESIGIAQARITCRWFQDAQLGFALSLNLGFARLGSVLTYVVSPYIVSFYSNESGTLRAAWFSFRFCLASALCGLILALMDLLWGSASSFNSSSQRYHLDQDTQDFEYDNESSILIRQATNPSFYGTTKSRACARTALPSAWAPPVDSDPGDFDTSYQPLEASSMAVTFNQRRTDQIGGLSIKSMFSESESHSFSQFKNIELCNVFHLNYLYWVVSLIIVCYYGSVIPFINVASDLLQQKWYSGHPIKSGVVLAIPDFLSTLLVPLLSYLLSDTQHRLWLTALCGCGVATVHAMIAVSSLTNPLWLMILLGFFYALLASSLWSLIPFLISDELLSLAYSMSTCLLNTILALGPLAAALLVNYDPTYYVLELCLTGLAVTGCMLALYTIFYVFRIRFLMLPSDLEEAIADDYEPIEEDDDFIEGEDNRRRSGEISGYYKGISYTPVANLPVPLKLGSYQSSCSMGMTKPQSFSSQMSMPIPMAGFPGGLSRPNNSQESLLTRQILNHSLARAGSTRSTSKLRRTRNFPVSAFFSSVNHDYEPTTLARRPLSIGSLANHPLQPDEHVDTHPLHADYTSHPPITIIDPGSSHQGHTPPPSDGHSLLPHSESSGPIITISPEEF